MSMKIEDINTTQLIADIRKIAAENPEHVYERVSLDDRTPSRCVYFIEGSPSCLVGQGFAKQGMAEDDLTPLDNLNSIGDLLRDRIYDVDPVELRWLDRVQEVQDQGLPWSEAVDIADDSVEGLAMP